jgi:Flp pilus assembly protein TadG
VLRDSNGAGLVELALTLPILLMFFFSVFEFGHQFYARLSMSHAVAEAARYAVTGNVLTDPETGQALERVESIRIMLEQHAANLAVEVRDVEIEPADGGGPGAVVSVSASLRYQYWLPGLGDILPPTDFTVTTAMKNEPFNP